MAQITLNSTGVASNGSLVLQSNGTTAAVTIDTSQRVAFVAGTAALPAITTTGDTNTGIFFPAADTVAIATSGAEVARFDSSGNFGLGVTPSAWTTFTSAIEVPGGALAGISANQVGVWQNCFYNSSSFKYKSTAAATLYQQAGGTHVWYNAASGTAGNAITFTQAMTLDASGNLLVGTTSGYGGNTRLNLLSSTNAIVANIYNSGSTSTTKLANIIQRVSSNASNADVNINFTDNVSNNYFFGGNNGGAYVMANTNGVRLSNGGTSWASDSDERLKDIIEPIINAAEKVSSLRAVIGKYKTDEEGVRRTFLIAQDVQAVLPEAVFDEQGTLMLAYTETIPLLVAAIQEQQALITQLTARLDAANL